MNNDQLKQMFVTNGMRFYKIWYFIKALLLVAGSGIILTCGFAMAICVLKNLDFVMTADFYRIVFASLSVSFLFLAAICLDLSGYRWIPLQSRWHNFSHRKIANAFVVVCFLANSLLLLAVFMKVQINAGSMGIVTLQWHIEEWEHLNLSFRELSSAWLCLTTLTINFSAVFFSFLVLPKNWVPSLNKG